MNEEQKTQNPIRSFRDLYAWQKGHVLVLDVYAETKHFPKDELFGLTNQMRRCAVSITSNVAEGFARNSFREKIQFFSITRGSISELRNQLQIAHDVGYLSRERFVDMDNQCEQVRRLVSALMRGAARKNEEL